MIKMTILGALLAFSSQALAFPSEAFLVQPILPEKNSDFETQALDWQVGDTADYKINLGGFINGTMKSHVREVTDDRVWIEQNADLSGQQQKVEILFDRNTHEVLEIRVNGQQQDLPDNGSQEVLENRQESITVAAGTFDSVYLKVRNTGDNQTVEVWMNPNVIPMTGMIKQIAQTQYGPMNVELVSFNKQ